MLGAGGAERRPGAHDQVQPVGIDLVDGSSDRRFAGHLTAHPQRRQRVRGSRGGPLGDRHERAGTGDHCAHRDGQDRRHFMPQPPTLPGIGHALQRGEQRCRRRRHVGELVLVELVNNGVHR